MHRASLVGILWLVHFILLPYCVQGGYVDIHGICFSGSLGRLSLKRFEVFGDWYCCVFSKLVENSHAAALWV